MHMGGPGGPSGATGGGLTEKTFRDAVERSAHFR
jgi:hypothetical protein